jgi:DNA-binding protein HU-beta
MLDLPRQNIFDCRNFPGRQEVAVNKSELVESIAQRAGLDRRQAEAAVGAFVDTVMDATSAGERVAILGFGTFNPTSRAARTGRNPQTGAPVKIAASKGVRFAPGAQFKTALNARGAGKKAASARKAATTKAAGKATGKAAVKASPATRASAKKVPAGTAAGSTRSTRKR